jgi:molybdenum cofactor cytidylyltransferase
MRMGRPKALLDFDGRSCLQVVVGACREAGLTPPIVVTRRELAQPLEQDLSAANLPATMLVNPSPDAGQTSSLAVGLGALPSHARAFLIYPVDTPLVEAGDIARLCAAFGDPGIKVVAPSFGRRRGHPVVVDAALKEDLLALPPSGSARDVLGRMSHATAFVAFEDDRALVDMDTPQDYQSCLQRFRDAARGRPRRAGSPVS